MSESAPKNHRKGHTFEMNGERVWIGKGGSSTQGDKGKVEEIQLIFLFKRWLSTGKLYFFQQGCSVFPHFKSPQKALFEHFQLKPCSIAEANYSMAPEKFPGSKLPFKFPRRIPTLWADGLRWLKLQEMSTSVGVPGCTKGASETWSCDGTMRETKFLGQIYVLNRFGGLGLKGAELFFLQQQNAMGSLRNIDFCVFWASWGGSGYKNRVPGTGSGNWFREPFDGFWQVRFCSRGLDGTGSGNLVPGAKGIKQVPDSGDSVPKVPKVTLYFESVLLYFESILILSFERALLYFESILKVYFCTLKVYFRRYLFCPLKGHFCTLKVYFCPLKVYFCTSKVQYTYFVLWKGPCVLWKYTFVLWKVYFCTLKVYFCARKVYSLYFKKYTFCSLKVYLFCPLKGHFCTLKVYFCARKVYFCTQKVY